ncbi:hypothetical protein TRIP_B330078 [uncultured Desulfatiglans sp.]|uniref:Uncharacterized protein n=1 Tax=Uncultured Desulfatiglans sp. TaxID=1748965 RepID=A0A653A8B9_UNCDX|nr:hypothetical protein TRIP_B330078 [uncultured Desulfatiglans sp.]
MVFLLPSSFHPERVFWVHLGVNLPVRLCGDQQAASAQTHDFLHIGPRPAAKRWDRACEACKEKSSFQDGNRVAAGNHFRMDTTEKTPRLDARPTKLSNRKKPGEKSPLPPAGPITRPSRIGSSDPLYSTRS